MELCPVPVGGLMRSNREHLGMHCWATLQSRCSRTRSHVPLKLGGGGPYPSLSRVLSNLECSKANFEPLYDTKMCRKPCLLLSASRLEYTHISLSTFTYTYTYTSAYTYTYYIYIYTHIYIRLCACAYIYTHVTCMYVIPRLQKQLLALRSRQPDRKASRLSGARVARMRSSVDSTCDVGCLQVPDQVQYELARSHVKSAKVCL